MIKRIFYITLLFGIAWSFDIKDFVVNPKVKDRVVQVNYRWTRNSQVGDQRADVVAIYTVGDPMALEVQVDGKTMGKVYYKGEKVLKQEISGYKMENVEIKNYDDESYKLVSSKNTTISVNGKTYNVLQLDYERKDSKETSKGNLVMYTDIQSTKTCYYDEQTGLLVKMEVNTDLTQKTYTIFDKKNPLNVRTREIREVLEVE